MNKIVEHLYVGTVDWIPLAEQHGFSILGACKEPLHRQHARLQGASEEGYITRSMPKNEPEYLYAERNHALYLNLIDAPDMKYIPDACIEKALDFIDKEMADGRNVLIVCNKAESRSPSIALMWMMRNNYFRGDESFALVQSVFRDKIFCPFYNPRKGMMDYVENFWNKHKEEKQSGKETKDF